MTTLLGSGQPSRLTPDQLSQLRSDLEEHRAFRTEQIDQMRTHAAEVQFAVDQEVFDQLMLGALTALDEIDAALARMDVGTYGRCVQCHRRLPFERLELMPQLARCPECVTG
jgi:RNA polymerase-binding transcription factor DksA